MIFSRVSTLKQYEKLGMLDIIRRKADTGIRVRIMIGADNSIKGRDLERLTEYPQIELGYLNKSIHTKLTTIVTDEELSLVIEEKENEDDKASLSLATYSNSESTVLPCVPIFENLWARSTSQSPL